MPPLDATAERDDWITAPAVSGKDDWVTAPHPVTTAARPTPAQADEAAGKQAYAAPVWTEAGPDANVSDTPSESGFGQGAKAVLNAAVQGYKGTPALQTPYAEDLINKSTGVVGEQLINPALHAAGVIPGTLNAGMAALSQVAMQVFGEKGGRDALALLATLPMVGGERMSPHVAAPTGEAAPPRPQFVSERFAPDVSELDSRNAIAKLIEHDINENPPVAGAAVDRGAANQGTTQIPAAVMAAPDIDGAIAAASEAAQGGGPSARPMSQWTQPLSGDVSGMGAPPGEQGTAARAAADAQPTIPGVVSVGSDATPQSVGAAASRDHTPPGQIEMAPADMLANRLQGEVERLASPPRPGDTSIYIPGTKPTLAEVTGDPKTAIDQKYNRQQPEAMQAHIEQENHNAEAVADYYADTAGSAQELQRLDRERADRADANVKAAFGEPDAARPPADPTPVINLMDGILNDPRMQERGVIQKTIPDLIDRFYNEDGSIKTDPLSLYGIREHIQDLLRGAGDPETSGAARVIRRELMQVQSALDPVIEAAAPGFAKFRAEYTADSRAIDAMKLLQDARLSLLNKDQHITPTKFFTFMKNVVEGRADPMDPAASLSESQMDRLWNISDQLKRSTFIDAGNPRGSPTSMLQEWGKRFGIAAAHVAVLPYAPVVGNIALKMGGDIMHKRAVSKEMNRVLNPDLGQPGP